MTLGEQQRLFSSLVAKLITFIYASGYECTFGEAYRSNEQAEINALGSSGRSQLVAVLRYSSAWIALFSPLARALSDNVGSGIRTSVHELRLAVDLNIFKGGVYMIGSESYRFAGDYWKSLHPLARWGGDFASKDGNHFSLEWENRK